MGGAVQPGGMDGVAVPGIVGVGGVAFPAGELQNEDVGDIAMRGGTPKTERAGPKLGLRN